MVVPTKYCSFITISLVSLCINKLLYTIAYRKKPCIIRRNLPRNGFYGKCVRIVFYHRYIFFPKGFNEILNTLTVVLCIQIYIKYFFYVFKRI